MAVKPWLRLYRLRSSRFEALSVFTRGLAAELMVKTDNDGCLRLGGPDEGALWRYIGAHPRERRTLSKHLKILVENGTIEATEYGWRFPSFGKLQPSKTDTGRARGVHGGGTGATRGVHGGDTGRARGKNEVEPKSTESLKTEKHSREEGEKRERREEQIPLRGTPGAGAPAPKDGISGGPLELELAPQDPPARPTLARVTKKGPKTPPRSSEAWNAYKAAYSARYGVEPIRNAKVNGQLSQLVKRLGSDAPYVAAFYVAHSGRWYVQKGHPVQALLADAESLHTQWRTDRRTTHGDAVEAERVDEIKNASERAEAWADYFRAQKAISEGQK